MATISLCMIVKNEERVLARCLDTIADLMDEIIIVDTGSTDATKEIAARYTDRIYDFPWCDDFSAARNFSFSLATQEYIYAADADEILDSTNRERFRVLKECLVPEVEIVQFAYLTKLEHNTVQNYSNELRPKLFKRQRTFTWIDPIHETVRLDPVVFDSDVEITHLPEGSHGKRDFGIFDAAYKRDGYLSDRIGAMYAKELFKCGDREDFCQALTYFKEAYQFSSLSQEASCILARAYRLMEESEAFFAIALKDVESDICSEICCELGYYYKEAGDYKTAASWFHKAVYETEAILDICCQGVTAYEGLAACYEALGDSGRAREYGVLARDWRLPESDAPQ